VLEQTSQHLGMRRYRGRRSVSWASWERGGQRLVRSVYYSIIILDFYFSSSIVAICVEARNSHCKGLFGNSYSSFICVLSAFHPLWGSLLL
jgi:hypothetical protein